jgi:RNA polymerase sigma-B factor
MSRDDAAARDEQETQALFERLPSEPAVRDQIAQRYAQLAEYLARSFSGRGEPLEDLVQVASIGLLNAIDRFDVDRGVRFSTYAAATIVGELKRHFRDKGWAIRVPRRLQEVALRLNQALPRLTQELGRSPTIGELARHLTVTEEEVVEAMEAAQVYSTESLDAPIGEGENTTGDTLGGADPSYEAVERWASIAPAIRDLSGRDRRVLYLRFFEGRTQSEIAGEVGVSQMHVSRILSQTIERLRRSADLEPGESQRPS